jgi:hypothetical protein
VVDKRTTFALADDISGEIFVKNISPSTAFIKSASSESIEPAVTEFIKTKLQPKKGFSYLLINAMGASDYFGSNLNADWFYDEVLMNHHKTFESYGHVYRHHVNKDETIAEGKVLFSHYNKKMHRVELIVEVEDTKVKDILERLSKGESVATSMACRVSHDECSICGNKAKRREDYCVHLKMFKNKVHTPTSPIPGAKRYGQKVYAINPDPKFFDISFVRIPADSTSSVLMKVAEAIEGKQAEVSKEAVIDKEVMVPLNAELIQKIHGHLPKETMNKLASAYSIPEIMTTMINMNMFPSRQDFQYMSMVSEGFAKEAEVLYDNNMTFDCTELNNYDGSVFDKVASVQFSDALANELLPYASELGVGLPAIVSRALTMEKEAQQEHIVNTIPYLGGVGAAYYAYNKLLSKASKSKLANALVVPELPPSMRHKITKFLTDRPGFFAAGLLGSGYLLNKMQRNYMAKEASLSPESINKFLLSTAIVSPAVFLYAARGRKKSLDGKELSSAERFVANHPYVTAAGASMLAPKVPKMFVKKSEVEDYVSILALEQPEEFTKLYEEIFK